MKRRYWYVALFGVPALLAAIIIALLLFGAAAGALWLFVLGDNSWPSSASNMLVAMLILVCMTLWFAFMSIAYLVGRKEEAHAAMNARHVWVSAGITALLVLLVASHQWSVGNIGTRSDSLLCSEYCGSQGFAGSGMAPRNTGVAICSCFDARGREAARISMREIAAEQRK